VDGEFFGGFHCRYRQGGDQRSSGAFAFFGDAYSVPLGRTNLAGSNCGRLSAGPCGVTHWETCRLVRQDAICRAVP
jgi:hypothetical protein